MGIETEPYMRWWLDSKFGMVLCASKQAVNPFCLYFFSRVRMVALACWQEDWEPSVASRVSFERA